MVLNCFPRPVACYGAALNCVSTACGMIVLPSASQASILLAYLNHNAAVISVRSDAPQRLSHRLQFEWHGGIDRRQNALRRRLRDIGECPASTRTWSRQNVAGTTNIGGDDTIPNTCKSSEHTAPTQSPVADEPLRAYNRYEYAVSPEYSSRHLLGITTAYQIEDSIDGRFPVGVQ